MNPLEALGGIFKTQGEGTVALIQESGELGSLDQDSNCPGLHSVALYQLCDLGEVTKQLCVSGSSYLKWG